MKELTVKVTPTQISRVEDELVRCKERPEYLSLRTTRGSVIGTATELRALADGLEATYSDDDAALVIEDRAIDKALTDEQRDFGVRQVRESVKALIAALRATADKADPYPRLANRAMARALTSGEAIDLAKYRQEDGTYLLPGDLDIEAKDLCDATPGIENWVWSVGKNHANGERRAALDDRFYGRPDWTCEWLR